MIARGILIPWIPKSSSENLAPASTAKDTRKKTGGKGTGANAVLSTPAVLTVLPEAVEDLQKALNVRYTFDVVCVEVN